MNYTEHEFALYCDDLVHHLTNDSITLHDEYSIQRIVSVLRLKLGESIVLFDKNQSIRGTIEQITKKEVRIRVVSRNSHEKLKPLITVVLPLLKKDALESALAVCVELGVTDIQLVTTQKTQNNVVTVKDKQRFERIMIATAEQSKQFIIPTLYDPLSLDNVVSTLQPNNSVFFLDPEGTDLLTVLKDIEERKSEKIVCIVGPEGDLTDQEKKNLKSSNVQFMSLTTTVLRSWHALLVGVGALRSLKWMR